MKYLISVSTFGIDNQEFANQIRSLLDDDVKVHPLEWQLKGGPQKLMDMLDTRDGKDIIIKVADQLVKHLQHAQTNKQEVIIISLRSGSRIVEEALSVIKGIEQLPIKITHFMFAPEINGSDWRSIGKYAASALLMGVAGIAAMKSGSKKGKVAGILGMLGGAALSKKSTISDHLAIKDPEHVEENEANTNHYVNVDRLILYNPEDASFNMITENLTNGEFYKGVYPINDIVSLDPGYLDQVFHQTKWSRNQEKTKLEIIRNTLG